MLKARKLLLRDTNDDFNDDAFVIPLTVTSISALCGGSFREWHVLPRSTHWCKEHFLKTDNPNAFLDRQFKESFRMTRQSFYRLHALLQPYIQKKETHLRPTIHSTIRLAIFLYHISHGAAYTLLVNQFGVGKSSVSGIIGDVARAIVQQLGTKYIRFPNIDEAMRSIEYWREKSGISGIVACIDGTHIPIIQPTKTGTAYCNRKGYYSINVQGMCDSRPVN